MPGSPRLFWSFGLTPVQSWIAEARRSRDLLAGSRMLAWVMADLLAALRQAGATVLLPRLDGEQLSPLQGSLERALAGTSATLPNRASGWLEPPAGGARQVFAQLEERPAARWSDLVREVGESARRSTHDLWNEIAGEVGEPACPFRLSWVAVEVDGGDAEGLAAVDRLFAAVKRSRLPRAHDGRPVRKCGQCGRREAMGGDEPAGWHRFQARLAGLDEVRRGLRFEAGEYLCPLCALRRLAGYLRDAPFPSTSAIAARGWRRELDALPADSPIGRAWRALEDAAARVPGYEPAWADRAPLLFPRTAERERRLARQNGDPAGEEALAHLLQRQRALARALELSDSALPPVPGDYVAVLMFDGDDLGLRLRQDLAGLPVRLSELQSRLGERLADPADPLSAAEPFYLGGDEGLLLVAAGEALPVARQVRALWSSVMGEGAGAATLSMGAALFDRERPVGIALEAARRALGASKRLRGKDALTVSVQTASGSLWSLTGRWREEWARIEAAVELVREGRLAAGWPYDVEAFLRTLPSEAYAAGNPMRRAIREEVKRLTVRRTLGRAGADGSGGSEGRTDDPWQRLDGESWWREEPPQALVAAQADGLHLVGFLVRQATSRVADAAHAAGR